MKKITGIMIEEAIMASYHNSIISVTRELQNSSDNSETLAVACQLICTDSFLIANANNADQLKNNVLRAASYNCNHYSGMEYNSFAFLDKNDPNYESEDGGLSRVDFNAIWKSFIKFTKG